MKRISVLLSLLLTVAMAQAVPAYPGPVQTWQPDGTTITVKIVGDEFYHFMTTVDDYTIVADEKGNYTYARLENNRLVSTGVVARDPAQRSAADRSLLAGLGKRLTAPAAVEQGRSKKAGRDGLRKLERYNIDGFRGLVILIDYTDVQFSMPDANAFYNDAINTEGFTGYTYNGRWQACTGSVRDYFSTNSMQRFNPRFDVVGPVKVGFASTDQHSTDNSLEIFSAALDSLDDEIDFTQYDADNDGVVDMVFFLVAGFTANYGNNGDLLWPHMYYLINVPRHDGMQMGLYACSGELYGLEEWKTRWGYTQPDGIGTICHEFSHVLGLPDLYDTDYEGSGGQSHHPGGWDVMAGGSYYNEGRTPVGYSLYERYSVGFAQPAVIDGEGTYTINPLNTHNEGLRLNTPVNNEYFLIENRQQTGWDVGLPGHGMLVVRVDSTDGWKWYMNAANNNPQHMYYELLRANNSTSGESAGDAFPGTNNVTKLNNFTRPSLMTWGKSFNDYAISGITETDGVITLNVQSDTSIMSLVEDFEQMPVTSDKSAKGVPGVYSLWDFTKCNVQAPDSTCRNGLHSVAMVRPSQITTTAPLPVNPFMVNFTAINNTGMEAKFQLYYSTDTAATWQSGEDFKITVDAKSRATAAFPLNVDKPVMLRITQVAGNTTAKCYLDDIVLRYTDVWPVAVLTGDVNGDGVVTIADANAVISAILNGSDSIDAATLARADVNGDGVITIADANAVIGIVLGEG